VIRIKLTNEERNLELIGSVFCEQYQTEAKFLGLHATICFREVERTLKKGSQKNQLQQSRGAPNVAIEARENSRIDNCRSGRA
jgi:hypothetical protein